MEGERKRYVVTSFWNDSWIQQLEPEARYFFLYLLTNPLTNVAGVYEITTRRMAFDTGIPEERVIEVLTRFSSEGKIHYENGYLILMNFLKFQNINNSKIQQSIDKILENLPESVLSYFIDKLWMSHACVMDESYMSYGCVMDNNKYKSKYKGKFKKEIRNRNNENSENMTYSEGTCGKTVDNSTENTVSDNPSAEETVKKDKKAFRKHPSLCTSCGAIMTRIDQYTYKCSECLRVAAWNTQAYDWLWSDRE